MNAPANIKPARATPDISLASIQIMDAARYLAMAASASLDKPGHEGWEYRQAMTNLEAVALSLGFELVKREAAPAAAPLPAPIEG